MNDANFRYQSMLERRSAPRTDVLAYIKVVPPDTTPIYYVEDISESGAFLVAGRKLAIGRELNMSVSIRLMPRDIDILCRVIRHDERGFAIQFLSMQDQDRILLRNYLYSDESMKIRAKYYNSESDS